VKGNDLDVHLLTDWRILKKKKLIIFLKIEKKKKKKKKKKIKKIKINSKIKLK